MENSQTWVEALKIDPDTLNQWSSQAPSGRPLLIWCLEEGHVPVSEYLLWASETSGLPILSSAFFENGGMNLPFFHAQRKAGTWGPWCFPVDKWEGVTYVACVEPPAERTPGICYVLADPRAMARIWEGTGSGVFGSQPSSEASLSRIIGPDDGPQGISASHGTSVFRLTLDENILPIAEPAAVEPDPGPSEDESDGEERTMVTQNALPLDDTPGGVDEFNRPQTPGSTGPGSANGPSALDSDNVGARVSLRLATPTVDLKLEANESAAVATVLAHVKKFYPAACLLKIAESTAKLHAYDGPNKADAEMAQVNLSYPSFLRIVFKTKLPYHGYLVDSPVHREFFGAFGMSQLPAVATAVPLKVNGRVWGILLALGPAKLGALENLAFVEDAANQLVTALTPIWSSAA